MSSNNFSEIFKIYEINPNQTNKAQKVRAYLRRQLKKNFPNKSLSDLTKVERDTFIYMIIKEDMMSRYINGQHRSRINNRINEYLRANLSLAELNVHKKQHFHSIINKQYYEEDASENAKQEAYGDFSKAITDFNPNVPVPSYDEWKKTPRPPYEYIADFERNPSKYIGIDDSRDFYAPTAMIDHYALLTLIKFIEIQYKKTINTDYIKECLEYIHNFPYDHFAIPTTEYKEKLNLSDNDYNNQLLPYTLYEKYKLTLDSLDFIEDLN